MEGQMYRPGLHYLTPDKTIVCRCKDMRHSGCKKVKNDEIITWSDWFYHYHPEEITCDREQWRTYSNGPPQNLQVAGRRVLEGVPDANELFDMALAKLQSAYTGGFSPYDALDVTKTYILNVTGMRMTPHLERMLLSMLRTDLQARPVHDGGLDMQREALDSRRRRSSVPNSSRTNPRLRSETGVPPVILRNPSNITTPQSASVSGPRSGYVPTPTQSRPKSSSSQHEQGVSSRNDDKDATTACLQLVLDAVPHAAPELILSLIDETTLCQKGAQRCSGDIINHLLDTNWEAAARSCSHNTHCGNDDKDATTACLQLVLNAVPHVAPRLVLSLIDEATLCQKGAQRCSGDIINHLLDTNWEAAARSCSHNTHCETEMAVEAQQLAQPSRMGSIDGLTQRVALEELTSPYQNPWAETPIESAGDVLGPSQEDTVVPGRYELPEQQSSPAIPSELPATAPTTNGRLQTFPGPPSPNAPPFNWQNPYGSPRLQPHGAAINPSVARSSRATMQPNVPHDAVVSASFSGSRPDFQSEFLEQNAMGLGPVNHARHEQLQTRKAKYPPAPYVSSPSPSPPPQNRLRITDVHNANSSPPHREHRVRHVQEDRVRASPSGRPLGHVVQRDANVSSPPRRPNIALQQYERPIESTSEYQMRRRPSGPVDVEGMYGYVDPNETSRHQANCTNGGVGSQGKRVRFIEQSSQDEWDDDGRSGRVRDV